MTGAETFEFAAAIAGVSIGLAAALILAVLGIVGVWQMLRRATEAQQAVIRASATVEEAVRRLETTPTSAGDAAHIAELQLQVDSMIQEQRRLQEMARGLLDTVALESGDASLEVVELESTVSRLDGTVGQMATSLVNLIQLLERQQAAQDERPG